MRLLGRESVVGSTEAIGLVARRCFFCDNRCALPLPSYAASSSMISRFLLCPASPSSTSMVEGESCCGRELAPKIGNAREKERIRWNGRTVNGPTFVASLGRYLLARCVWAES